MRLLSKQHGVVAKAASTDETRYILQSVLIESTDKGMRTTATDGRMLAIVEEVVSEFKAEDYPANVIPSGNADDAAKAIVPADVFIAAFKSVKRSRKLPILESVAVAMGSKETTLATTDLAAPTVRTATNTEGIYPNYEQVIPRAKAELAISFSPVLFGRALKIAEDFGLDCIDMEFTGSLNPVKMTGTKDGKLLTLVVMPMRSLTKQTE